MFLRSRYAPLLTHGALLVLSASMWGLLWFTPLWLMFIPGTLLAHRIGILLHEYLHGIPFRNYRSNLAVYGFFDGTMLMFGLMELFRGTHLTHHRWLNAPGDNAARPSKTTPRHALFNLLISNEAVQHLLFLWEAIRGRQAIVRLSRVASGAAFSTICILGLLQLGRGDVVLKLIAVNFFTVLIPVSLRGAIEHHGPAGATGFANEYHTWIPLFNLNRHIHHHEDMHCPWYLLQYRSANPLAAWNYFTYWYHVYVSHDYVLMRPMSAQDLTQSAPDHSSENAANSNNVNPA
ncbi:MAG: fatty acid desaturase [Planctomyces sp.]|nr:fatty acid desaturase [Planctomyces sp.]